MRNIIIDTELITANETKWFTTMRALRSETARFHALNHWNISISVL